MENVNKCECLENNLRTHHGIVCTKCNPESIDPFIVLESIKAQRVWRLLYKTAFMQLVVGEETEHGVILTMFYLLVLAQNKIYETMVR